MNLVTYSPVLVLLYVGALLCILMDVRVSDLSPKQRWLVPLLLLALFACNQGLRLQLGVQNYGKLIFFTMHLPYFLLFLWMTKCGAIKMVFMIFTAVIFTAPTVLLGTVVRTVFVDSRLALLFSNLLTYSIMLLIAKFGFLKDFGYLVKYGENRFFLRFSFIPFLYYIYLFASMNLDFSFLDSVGGKVVRLMPTVLVFAFYYLLPNIYKELNEKRKLDMAAAVLTQELNAAEAQIVRLNETQTQTAVYQHDMRHHLTAIDAFLSSGKPQQAREYIQKVQKNVEAVTPKRFCENELVNLLCSSFADRAERQGIRLTVEANLPKIDSISDIELCAVLSNGLENALHAAAEAEGERWVELYCKVNRNKLLIEIKNPYAGEILMQNGLPVSRKENHGYGCYSIRAIAQQYQGICTFETENNVFTLRVILLVRDVKENV